ncbi:MAG: hypothetical protein ACN6OR_07395 [Stenotrophomonas sp.]
MSPSLPPMEAFLQAIERFAAASNAPSAEQAMAAVADTSASLPLDNLDRLERRIRWELSAAKPAHAGFWSRAKPARHLSWLDLGNADGHVRERTLRSLSAAPNALCLALALRRLNDWVPEVRAAAREHLPGIAHSSAPEHVAEALWAVLCNVASWGRLGTPERHTLDALIAFEPVRLALYTRICNAATGPATSILVQITRTPVFDPWLHTLARQAVQPAVRARTLRFLLEGRAFWFAGRAWTWTDLKWCEGKYEPVIDERPLQVNYPRQQLLETALRDAAPAVRHVAAETLILHLPSFGAQASALATILAADRSARIAARGRFVLAQLAKANCPA